MSRVVLPTHDCLLDLTIEPAYLSGYLLCAPGNEEMLAEMYVSWISLLGDSPLSDSSKRPVSVVRQFFHELLEVPFPDIVKKYATLLDAVMATPTLYGAGSLQGEFCHGMKDTPIFYEYHRFLKTGDHKLYAWILSFLKFPKKFEYQSDDLHVVTLRKWRASEERLSSLVLDERVCSDIKVIVTHLTAAYETLEFKPMFRHGPGTVSNTKRGPGNKSKACYIAPPLMEFYEMEGILADNLPNVKTEFVVGRDDEAEYIEAPKSATIRRSICREPAGHMYAQQGVLNNLLCALDSGPMTRFVDLTNQEKNREAALFGSYTGLVDTIDLSSASDLVSVELVRRIFSPRLLSHLLATRTSKVRIRESGEVVVVKKFAPMGSALCFPVQCIIYTAAVLYAHMMLQADGDPKALEDVVSGCESLENFTKWLDRTFSKVLDESKYPNKCMPPRIFGDDIVCDFRVTDVLSKLLDDLGFLVNHEKSFVGSQAIRESCGGYYWNGHDVTPLYWTPWNQGYDTQQAIVPLVAFTNRAFAFGYARLHSTLIHIVEHRCVYHYGKKGYDCIERINYVPDRPRLAFFTTEVRPDNARNRYNVDLQRWERRYLGLKVNHKEYDHEEFERWRLHEAFRSMEGKKTLDSDSIRLNLFERWGLKHHNLLFGDGIRPTSSFKTAIDFSMGDSGDGTLTQPFSKSRIAWDVSIKWKWYPL